MAHHGESIKSINGSLVGLESNYAKYASSRGTIVPDIAKDIQCIRTWVEKQEVASQANSQIETINKLADVTATTVSSLNSLSSGDPLEVMKGCLFIASSIAVFVGSSYGAAAGAICHVLGLILSIKSPAGPDLATVFMEKVHVEHQKFKSEKFSGLQLRVRFMCVNLKSLKTTEDLLGDKALIQTDFPQFIGELAHNFANGLSPGSKVENIHDCLTSMVAYCNAVTSFLVLLSNVLAAFQRIGCDTTYIERLLKEQINDAFQKLEYLSEVEKYMLTCSPNEKRKLYLAFHLRNNLSSYEIVEGFRQGLGMTKMLRLEKIREIMAKANLPRRPKDITHLYCLAEVKGENPYFQLINHTSVPVKVVCDGNVGDHINGLKFRHDLPPFSSYEHIASRETWHFSTGGFFLIYLDGNQRSFEDMFEGMNFRVFAFALSNPLIGIKKLAILEKTNDLSSATGNDCWNQMNSNCSPPINFVHGDKHYTVFGIIRYAGNKLSSFTWQFVVQEYDPRDMEEPLPSKL